LNQTVVIYESKYGFTRRYAQWLSESLSCPLFERKDFEPKDFKKYETVIYGGGLYAGGVSGIRLLTQNRKLLSGKRVILFTCGLADPTDITNVSHILKSLSKALPAEMMDSMKIFHFRGGIDYPKLGFVHKSMMSMLRRMLLKKDASELSSEDSQLLETYGKTLDFTDRAALRPMLDYITGLNNCQ